MFLCSSVPALCESPICGGERNVYGLCLTPFPWLELACPCIEKSWAYKFYHYMIIEYGEDLKVSQCRARRSWMLWNNAWWSIPQLIPWSVHISIEGRDGAWFAALVLKKVNDSSFCQSEIQTLWKGLFFCSVFRRVYPLVMKSILHHACISFFFLAFKSTIHAFEHALIFFRYYSGWLRGLLRTFYA